MDNGFKEAEEKWLSPEEDTLPNIYDDLRDVIDNLKDKVDYTNDDEDLPEIERLASLVISLISDYQLEKAKTERHW